MLSLPTNVASAAAVYALHFDARRELITQSHPLGSAHGLRCSHRTEHVLLRFLPCRP